MAENKKPRDEINSIARQSGFSDVFGSITDVFKGIDHRNAGSNYRKNDDHHGLTLFTRPRMNLTYNNVLADRQLHPLLSRNPLHMYNTLRLMLSPTLVEHENLTSPVFDHKMAFIPLLSNTLLNVSGFPDVTLNTYTSPEGIRKETWSMGDDVAEINSAYDITATFANIQGDPITALFHTWIRYIGNVYSGDMVAFPEHIIENEIDYQTRIWRIILDSSKRYVRKIGCANAAYPMASPLGNSFNVDTSQAYVSDNDQISIPFRCMGAEYNDPILYDEFNLTVQYFNPAMRDHNRNDAMIKLGRSEAINFNYRGYPRIDRNTLELEWWVTPEVYLEIMGNQS